VELYLWFSWIGSHQWKVYIHDKLDQAAAERQNTAVHEIKTQKLLASKICERFTMQKLKAQCVNPREICVTGQRRYLLLKIWGWVEEWVETNTGKLLGTPPQPAPRGYTTMGSSEA
jgi:hypothetical protein